jgi:hypothetical protein
MPMKFVKYRIHIEKVQEYLGTTKEYNKISEQVILKIMGLYGPMLTKK